MSMLLTWRPGIYLTTKNSSQDFGSYLTSITSEIAANSAIRGGQWRFWLDELMTGPGQYDWTNMDLLLNAFVAIDSPVFVMFQCRSFNLTDHPCPSYMRGDPATYGTVEYEYNSGGGYNIYWPSTIVQAEMTAFATAFGIRYNTYPCLEGVMVSETARGTPSAGELTAAEDTALDNSGYVNGLLTFTQALAAALPDKQVFQYCNSTRAELETFIPNTILANGIGIAATDCFIDNENSTSPNLNYQSSPYGVYYYLRKYKNVVTGINQVPLCVHWQPDSYRYTQRGGEGAEPTIAQLYDFSVNRLGANYILCTRETVVSTALSPLKYYETLYNELANSQYLGQPWAGCVHQLPLSK